MIEFTDIEKRLVKLYLKEGLANDSWGERAGDLNLDLDTRYDFMHIYVAPNLKGYAEARAAEEADNEDVVYAFEYKLEMKMEQIERQVVRKLKKAIREAIA